MKHLRFFCCPINAGINELTGPEAHHLATVRRLVPGDIVELFDGAGGLAAATVVDVTTRKVTLNVKETQTVPTPERPRIVIAAGVAKNRRFDWLISKCTELGVDRISPVIYDRAVKQARGPGFDRRLQGVAIAAAKQCGRLFLPQIDSPNTLEQTLASLLQDYPTAEVLIGTLRRQAPPLVTSASTASDMLVFVGPEGGLTEREEKLLLDHHGRCVRLGDTTLRVETAALAFAAILNALRDAHK